MMADYIEREAVLALGYWHGEHPDFDNPNPDGVDAVDTSDIEAMPAADVVEVVRCKDCKYCHRYMSGNIYCEHSEGLTSQGPDAFCSYGKRREK